jgi:hypothetical protein
MHRVRDLGDRLLRRPPSTGSVVDLAAANLFTAFRALCFLVGAVPLLRVTTELETTSS